MEPVTLSMFHQSDTTKWVGRHLSSVLKPTAVNALNALKVLELKIRSTRAVMHPQPIFVLGNQKSGTSIIAALLAKATGLSVSLDLVREYLSDGTVYIKLKKGKKDLQELIYRNKLDFSRQIIKEANLTPFFEDLIARFPDSRYVFIVRDPADNIRSQLNRWDIPGNQQSLSHKKMKSVKKSWHIVFNGEWLGFDGNGYVEMMSHRWRYMADIYLKNSDLMTLIRYEDFLEDKEKSILSLAEAIGLKPSNNIVDSVDVQYQSKGEAHVDLLTFFGYQNLENIYKICGDRMPEFGYDKCL